MLDFVTYIVYWGKCFCPSCQAANWLYFSHSERAYPDTPEACECWKCYYRFYLGSEDEFKMQYSYELEEYCLEQVIDNIQFEKGRESPIF